MYTNEFKKDGSFKKAMALSDKFTELEGRRPRILIATIGKGYNDRSGKIIGTSFADMGFDVDIAPLFKTFQEVAKQAIENDVHILCFSNLSERYQKLIPEVFHELKKYDRDDILVMVGEVMPTNVHSFLKKAGVVAIFETNTKISKSAIDILELLISYRA